MAANTCFSGTGDNTLAFDKPIDHLNVFVATGVTCAISLNKGVHFITIPEGFYSFRVGPVKEVQVQADGEWQLIGVQA